MGDSMVACRSIALAKWPDAWRRPADWCHGWSRIGDGRRRDFPAPPAWTSDPPDQRPLPPEPLPMGILAMGARPDGMLGWGVFASLCLSMVVFRVFVLLSSQYLCCLSKSS